MTQSYTAILADHNCRPKGHGRKTGRYDRPAASDDEVSGKGMTPAVKAVQAKYGDAVNSPSKVESKQVEKNLEVKFD